MDYQALSMLVPKPVESWTLVQIRKWLHFIDLQKFLPLFENNNFNGELLTKTTIKTLSMMGINSNIQQKKFMAWIERGFVAFNDYLFNSNMDKENICPNLNQRKITTQKMNKKMPLFNSAPLIAEDNQMYKLKITNYEGPQTVNYIADRKGLRIGRIPKNQIQSLEVTVENNHAKIYLQGNDFYICDVGTKSGTFIKVHPKIEILPNMLIQLGSYLFMVKQTLNQSKQVHLDCVNINTGMKEELCVDLNQKPCFYFGRKNNNDFARDDQHMSGTHARIQFLNGKFILEDLDSTNGTWLRLSQPRKQSIGFKIENGTIFKIGNTITYICSQAKDDTKMQIEDNSHICVMCNKDQKNILFWPCKHTITCENCSISHTHCSLCNHIIEKKVRIYV